MKKILLGTVFLSVTGILWYSIFAEKSGAVSEIKISGSSTLAPLISDLAEKYENEHNEVKIYVQSGGSSKGVSDARKHIVDIGMVSRKMKSSESDLQNFHIASDNLVLIANKENPIQSISYADLIKVYKGEIDNWSYFNKDWDKEIVVLNKAEGRSTLEAFLKFSQLKNSEIKQDIIIGDNQQGIKTVIGNRYSIGYVSSGTARYSVSNNENLKIINLVVKGETGDAVEIDKFALRQLNLVLTSSGKNATIDGFIDYCRSEKAYGTIEKHYFDPVKEI